MHKLTFASKVKHASFTHTGTKADKRVAEVDLVPMINVVFLLLIFFMVSAVFRTMVDANIKLPGIDTKTASPDNDEQNLVSINASGDYFSGGVLVTQDQLGVELQTMDPDQPLVLQADARSPAADVATVLKLAADAGIQQAGLQTINRTTTDSSK